MIYAGVSEIDVKHERFTKNVQSYLVESIIWGYQIYKEVWDVSVGQILPTS